MDELIIASGNTNKISEIRQLTGHMDMNIISMHDAGINDEIEENGTTLDQNSWIKAAYIFDMLGKNTLAEDTGLEVKAIGNAPGVYSARYAGEQKSSEDNMRLLLENLKDKIDRSARFRTVATIIWQYRIYQFEGIVEGQIINQKKGADGFGYDPIFMPDGYDITFAEMSKAEKNQISHRGKAIRKVIDFIESRYKNPE